ncbi:T9SS type B sorting domain-containing protein [Mangrovimonas spongiae]|uniref:Gliding motility-associated C-terminal domain-containing protein n=1 Tax=Mangrovimonas spongiae TaxID=2494697 RepID=A0A3R9M9V5_9FLAO|nr:T9SS type B sorting domain-containing protein [Mangrovimonas spongiae]RSK40711.1 gliding motility-associated C-terminal domain-containing protein [Mangrovimonas spongiae]
MKNYIFYFALILFTFSGFSQDEAANWYFGENAGIHFNDDGTVNSLNNGQLNTREGCSSISDKYGNLLFYTDGVIVYNSNHSVMENGMDLNGDSSSTQSAIVVPRPNNPDIYYIFTVGSNQTLTGFNYSIVDMSANNGLGKVVTKNINLLDHCAEKITAVLKDCNSGDIWVVVLSTTNGNATGTNLNTFYAYEISSTGVNTNAITSTFSQLSTSDLRGYLKISPDGAKLACANVQDGLYLFDFDQSTGQLSNIQPLSINEANNKAYGLEFSPDNTKLYVTATNDFNGAGSTNPSNHHSVLVQFDVTSNDIQNSQITIDQQTLYRSALQLGPDGKIYRSMSETYNQGSPFLSVINDPNELGTLCNYQNNAISLGQNDSTQGLPPFIVSFFSEKVDIINNGSNSNSLVLCEGDSYTLSADPIPGATYTWYMDGVHLTETDNDLVVTQSAEYTLQIEFAGAGECDFIEGEAYVEFNENPDINNATLVQCDDNNDGYTTFNLNQAQDVLFTDVPENIELDFYESQQDLQNDTAISSEIYSNISNQQVLFVKAIDTESGCFSTAQLTLDVVPSSQINDIVINDCDILDSEDGINTFNLEDITTQIQTDNNITLPITYYASSNDALLETNSLSSPYNNTTPYSQTIFARAENSNGCYGISEVQLNIEPLPNLEDDETLLYCLNTYPQTITLNSGVIGNSNNYTYSWSNGEQTESIQINEPGTYTVTVTNSTQCSKTRTITVEASNIATIDNINVVDISENNSITVITSGEGIYEYALLNEDGTIYANYQTSNTFNNIEAGIYTVSIRDTKNDCGIVSESVAVIGYPKFFTPNGDGYNDRWNIKGISNTFQPNTKLKIFDRYGKLLKQINPLGEGWDGSFNGEIMPTDDYWFSVDLQDGRTFRSHFTLKR